MNNIDFNILIKLLEDYFSGVYEKMRKKLILVIKVR